MPLLQRLKRKITYLKDRKLLRMNRALKGIHAKERCFIIGNGPSLKGQDLSGLSLQWTFATNSFFRHEQYDAIHPKFYVMIDSEFFKGNEGSVRTLKELGEKIHPDTLVFLPLKARKFIEDRNFLPDNKKYYFYVSGEFRETRENAIELDGTIPTPMGAGLLCMLIAEYMGFAQTYLLGFDHNWLAQRVDAPVRRFYEGHYIDDERTDTYELRAWSQYILFRNYRLLKKRLQTEVINLTPGSFLDVFPTGAYEEALTNS